MPAIARFHYSIPNAILQEADVVFHDPVAFHPANGMFNPDADGRDSAIRRLLRGCEFPTTWVLLGVDHRDAGQDASLEAPILIATTAGGQAIALQIRQAFIIRFAFIGGTQDANLTSLINDKEGFDGVARLLAPIGFL